LPLELTAPIELEADLETLLADSIAVEDTKYNPETQVRENSKGVPDVSNLHGRTASNCKVRGVIVVDDVVIDL